jgi:AIPR protein
MEKFWTLQRMVFSHQAAFDSRSDLEIYGSNALLLFALEMKFQIEDIKTVAADSLTDGSDDKKCDLVYVNTDIGYIVVAQGYYASEPANKNSAPANKASDLNTAAAWLFNSPIDDLPEKLQSVANQIHLALEANQIRFIQFWYVHNLPESINVKNELSIVESTITNSLRTKYSKSNVNAVSTVEIGQATLEEWYKAIQVPILVTDSIEIPINGGYEISEEDWSAYVTAIPVSWLYKIFNESGKRDKLFSANVRSYLGSRRTDANINSGIKVTANEDPGHFWVFNNGLTVLVNSYDESENPGKNSLINTPKTLRIQGISIVNGAQTTGAIGSLSDIPNEKAMVQARFVKCSNIQTVKNIIEFNNKQNPVEPSDFRSNDPIQSRLRDEFSIIFPDITYLGCRRGGYEDRIRRPTNLLASDTVAQALAAFHQYPVLAYNQKSDIWLVDSLYSKFFNDQTSPEHILFTFSLLRSIEGKKEKLNAKLRSDSLTESESQYLTFLQQRGSHLLFVAAIAKCLETLIGKPINNYFRISFSRETSLQSAQEIWSPIVDVTIAFCENLRPAVQKSLKNADEAVNVIKTFKSLVEAIKLPNAGIFEKFAASIFIRDI